MTSKRFISKVWGKPYFENISQIYLVYIEEYVWLPGVCYLVFILRNIEMLNILELVRKKGNKEVECLLYTLSVLCTSFDTSQTTIKAI